MSTPAKKSGSPIMAGTDRTRIQAAAPTSGNQSDFEPLKNVIGRDLKAGELELIEGHGVIVGMRNGLLVVRRKYVPTVQGLFK